MEKKSGKNFQFLKFRDRAFIHIAVSKFYCNILLTDKYPANTSAYQHSME